MEPIAFWTMDSEAGDAVGVVEMNPRSSSATTSTASLGDTDGSSCGGEVDVLDLPLASGFAKTPTAPKATAGSLQKGATAERRPRAPCVATLMLTARLRRATHDDPREGRKLGRGEVLELGAVAGGARWMRSSMLRAPGTTASTTKRPHALGEVKVAHISTRHLTLGMDASFSSWDPLFLSTAVHVTIEVGGTMAMALLSPVIRRPHPRLRNSAADLPRMARGERACRQRSMSARGPTATAALLTPRLRHTTTRDAVGLCEGEAVWARDVGLATSATPTTDARVDLDTLGTLGLVLS